MVHCKKINSEPLEAGGLNGSENNNIHIITENVLNYIDTLYLYNPKMEYYDYFKFVEYVVDNCKVSSGVANGRSWYVFDNFRIGIMDYETAKKSNQYEILVQLDWNYLVNQFKYDSSDVLLNGLKPLNEMLIKRIDLTKTMPISKHLGDICLKQNYIYKSNFKMDNEYKGTRYLGNRSNGAVFRIYNKTLELEVNKNIDKYIFYSKFFNDEQMSNLYTFELELHRRYMQPLGINTLSDFDTLNKLYSNIVGSIEFFRLNDTNLKHYKNYNYDYIDAIYKIDNKMIFNRPKRRLNKNKFISNTSKRLIDIIDNYTKIYDVDLDEHQLILLFDEIYSNIFVDSEYKLTFNYS